MNSALHQRHIPRKNSVGTDLSNIRQMTATEMQAIGEQHVREWLEASGYSIVPAQAASPDIAATGKQANLLVRVLSGGEDLGDISPAEKKKLTSQASALGYAAWLAKVRLGLRGAIIGKIQWTQLN